MQGPLRRGPHRAFEAASTTYDMQLFDLPYGHTLAKVIPAMEALIGNVIERLIADTGYRGHNAPPITRSVSSPRVRSATSQKRSNARCEGDPPSNPVIGHLKNHHRMGRNHLAHRAGDAANAILAAAGYNFRLLIRWFRLSWRQILQQVLPTLQLLKEEFFTVDDLRSVYPTV